MELSKNTSVKLIGLNYRDNLNNAKKFINELGNPYTQILIDSDGILGVEFGAYGVPETFLIDKNKKIIKKFVGPINQEILEEIRSIIK
jgi:cytochrome c biogenesis protein CcmG/thiol:disulfide interchange protein DsbE